MRKGSYGTIYKRRYGMWKACWNYRNYNMSKHFNTTDAVEKIIPYDFDDDNSMYYNEKSIFNTKYKKTLCFVIHLKLNGQKRFLKFKK